MEGTGVDCVGRRGVEGCVKGLRGDSTVEKGEGADDSVDKTAFSPSTRRRSILSTASDND